MSDADENIVIEQRLLKMNECFVYKIPPMRSADGHRADDWNLAAPLATCSLAAVRRGDELHVDLLAARPKPGAPAGAMETYLFAQSRIAVDLSNPSHTIGHWVNQVVDSSRYFAVRIQDARTGREAFVGVGFRERTDATNFRMTTEDYINALKREEKAAALRKRFEESAGENVSGDAEETPMPKSSFSLKEGEKLHVNIKGARANRPLRKSKNGAVGLKKPPPPPDATPAEDVGAPSPSTNAESSDVDWGDFAG